MDVKVFDMCVSHVVGCFFDINVNRTDMYDMYVAQILKKLLNRLAIFGRREAVP